MVIMGVKWNGGIAGRRARDRKFTLGGDDASPFSEHRPGLEPPVM